jgi:hypothetical protein
MLVNVFRGEYSFLFAISQQQAKSNPPKAAQIRAIS